MSPSQRQAIIDRLLDNMVYVEGGTFMMGATSDQGSDAYNREEPAHRVTLSSFYIGKYEVTQDEWQAVMDDNPSEFQGDNLPVEQVSWVDCQEFIRKLNSLTGKKFRLPTEAEWEYAARGGNKSRGYKYAGSNNLNYVAWYDENSGNKTHPVGTKAPNELGLYDMSGNSSEWCYDVYHSYSSSAQINPTGPTNSEWDSFRVFRGGSCTFFDNYCRVSTRFDNHPEGTGNTVGLRLCSDEGPVQQSVTQTPSSSDVEKDETIYKAVEQMPEFPGGQAALLEWISSHIQYPAMAAENNIQGKVTVQLVVTKTGGIGEVKVVRSVDKDLDREAVRVVKSLPKFNPGRQNGQPVNVWYTLPINFKLRGTKSE